MCAQAIRFVIVDGNPKKLTNPSSPMKKIVHIITRLDSGGSAQNTLITCRALSKKYEVILAHGLSLESKMTDWEKNSVGGQIKEAQDDGMRFVPIRTLVRRISPACDISAFFSVLRLLVREKPAIVHTHTYKAGVLGCWAAKLAGIHVIVHTPHGHVFFGHFSRLVTRFFMMIERITTSVIDCVVALTEGERDDYIKFSVSKPDTMVTIHSGVDVTRFMKARISIEEKKRSLGLNTKGLVVGTIGWLLPIKGPLYLLKAMEIIWRTNPGIQLVYVGKGDLEEEVRSEVTRMGVSDKVSLLGWRDDIHEIMPILDVFVLPSLNEGMGRVLAEAMAAGRPIVASRVGGIPDLVKDGYNGFLADPGDVDGLRFAIERLIANRNLRDEMGRKGRALAEDYSVEKMIDKIDALYTSLFGGKFAGR
jgi:glycosyltransferase involved in cell wall biosynthesis